MDKNYINATLGRFIDIPTLQVITSLSTRAIYKFIELGELNVIKLGGKTVFCEEEIRQWMQSKRDARGTTNELP